MILLRIAVAMLLLLPVAAADGIHVNARYLEADESCWSRDSSGSWSNNDSSHGWYGSQSGCVERLTYVSAAAGDDDGDMARADVDGYNANRSTYDQSYGYGVHDSPFGTTWYGFYGSFGTHETTWSRAATVSTREAQLQAEHRCRDSTWNEYAAYDRETYGSNTSDASHGWRIGYGEGSGCDDEVRAQAAGEDVRATRWDACSFSEGYSSSARQSSWYGEESEVERSSSSASSSCGHGVAAARGDDHASAALVSACTQSTRHSTFNETYGNETYEGYSGGSWESCSDGVWLDSSEGASGFAGSMRDTESVCYGSNAEDWCWDYESRFTGVYLDWAHNPFGPHPVVIGLP